MGDQHANARESERIGFGIHLSFQSMTPKQISGALNKVLNDPKYLRRAQEHGSALMDQKASYRFIFFNFSFIFFRQRYVFRSFCDRMSFNYHENSKKFKKNFFGT